VPLTNEHGNPTWLIYADFVAKRPERRYKAV